MTLHVAQQPLPHCSVRTRLASLSEPTRLDLVKKPQQATLQAITYNAYWQACRSFILQRLNRLHVNQHLCACKSPVSHHPLKTSVCSQSYTSCPGTNKMH